MKSVNLNEIKSKFGQLLSFATLQCQIKEDVLSAKIVQNKYFDFLEDNNYDKFLKDDIESVCFNILGADIRNGTNAFRNDMQYVGESYISICVSLGIPLRKLVLLYPIEKMLLLFPTYHEMSPFRIIERVYDDIKNITSFSILLKQRGYGVNTIAKLCRVNRRIITSLKDNPYYEEYVSKALLDDICSILDIDKVFLSKSSFVPYYFALWNDDTFKNIFKDNLENVISSHYTPVFNGEDIHTLNAYALIDFDKITLYSTRKERELPPNIFNYLIKLSIDDLRIEYFKRNIAYC